MQEGLVTVVVPVYKTEKYLDRCVDSIVNQTYRKLEIILVDDGSPDKCPQMCDKWAKEDSRIKVIHKENQGLGRARNTGIDNANGEYICFFDSDDYIAVDAIELAYEMAHKENADTVIFGLASVDSAGTATIAYLPKMEKNKYSGGEVQDVLLPKMIGSDPKTGVSAGLPMGACCELISTKLIRCTGWRFVSEREIVSEDIYSIIALYTHVQKAVILSKVLYYYRENLESVSRTYRADRYEKNKYFYTKCLELCDMCKYSDEVVRRCAEPFLGNTIAALKQETAYHDRKTAVKHLKSIIDDDLLQKVLRDKKKDKTNLKKRILFWIIRNRCYLLCYVLLIGKSTMRK